MNGFARTCDLDAALAALIRWQRAADAVAHHLDRLADPCAPRGARPLTDLANGGAAIAEFAAGVRMSIEEAAEIDHDLASHLRRLDGAQ